MNLTNKALLLSAGILSSTMVFASEASVSLTNNMIKADTLFDVGNFALSLGGAHDGQDVTTTLYAGIGVQDSSSTGPLQVGLDIRAYALDNNLKTQNGDIDAAIGLGGWYRYTFPKANRLSLYASGHYAPSILSFSGLDNMYTYEVRGEYMTTQNTRVYVGYGTTVSKYSNGDRRETLNGLTIGASATF